MKAARRLVSPRFFSTAPDGAIEDGLKHVSATGPVLLVGNHQLFGLDGVLLVEEFLKERRLALTPLVYPPLLDDESPLTWLDAEDLEDLLGGDVAGDEAVFLLAVAYVKGSNRSASRKA